MNLLTIDSKTAQENASLLISELDNEDIREIIRNRLRS
jgi:hypothetical protein